MKIRKAILPVAGLGTRFLPATKAQPKEMLPIFDTPAIQLIVEEAVAAGVQDVVIVTGRGKRAIEDHFDRHGELEEALREQQKTKELQMIQQLEEMANFIYVRQPKPLGDGHALLCAEGVLDKGEPVVVLFGDDLVDNPGGKNAVEQLMEVYEAVREPVVLLEQVPREEAEKYGMVEFEPTEKGWGKITRLVEKPKPEDAPSDFAVVGKFILTPEVFGEIEKSVPGKDGEIRLSNGLQQYLENGGVLYGKVLEGKRFDTGDKMGFLQATVHYALKKEGKKVVQALRGIFEEE